MRGRAMVVAVAIAAVSVPVPGSSPAAAAETSVADEAGYRSALATLSADGAGPHTLRLTDDIEITSAGDPTYSGTEPLTIDGAGHAITVTAPETRALLVTGGAPVTVEGIEVTGPDVTGDGGALHTDGSLTVRASHLHSSSATGAGGAVWAAASAVIERSTLDGNGASTGGAVRAPVVAVESATLTGNTATTAGGAVSADELVLDRSTVIENGAPTGANLDVGELTGTGSVVALPVGGTDCEPPSVTQVTGFRFSDHSCGAGQVLTQAPVFAALADNGGPTPTREPGPRQDDVILHGYHCATGGLFLPPPELPPDQRGLPRGTWALPAGLEYHVYCDVGAVEVERPTVGVEVEPESAAIVTGEVLHLTAELTNTGRHAIVRWGDAAAEGCTEPVEPLLPGASSTITCDWTAGTPNRVPSAQSRSFSAYSDWKSGSAVISTQVRVLCDAHTYIDVPAHLDRAVAWFVCEAEQRYLGAGGGPRRFGPGRAVDRLEAAWRLWVGTGRPDVAPRVPYPFPDVPPVQRELVRDVTGDPDGPGPRASVMERVAPGRFGPARLLTRGQLARGLWRDAGRPQVSGAPFTDVPPRLRVAVAWATTDPDGAGPLRPVLRVAGNSRFRPGGQVTRGTLVAALHRAHLLAESLP